MSDYKNNLPTDAQFYTVGELKKYYKLAYSQEKLHWWIWSRMLNKWIVTWEADRYTPEDVEMV